MNGRGLFFPAGGVATTDTSTRHRVRSTLVWYFNATATITVGCETFLPNCNKHPRHTSGRVWDGGGGLFSDSGSPTDPVCLQSIEEMNRIITVLVWYGMV